MMQLRQAVVTEYTLCSDEEWKMVDGKLGKKMRMALSKSLDKLKKTESQTEFEPKTFQILVGRSTHFRYEGTH